jgi:hypothetical protein
LRERALVVRDIGGGGLGDGDADSHGEISLSEDGGDDTCAAADHSGLVDAGLIQLMLCES